MSPPLSPSSNLHPHTQVVTDGDLVARSESFEQAIAGGDRSSLRCFCATKGAEAGATGSQDEAETWAFLSVLFEDDARRQLLGRLGFGDALAVAAAAERTGSTGGGGVGAAEQSLAAAVEAMGMEGGGVGVEWVGGGVLCLAQSHLGEQELRCPSC